MLRKVPDSPWLKRTEAAEEVGMSLRNFEAVCESGDGPPYYRRLYHIDELHEWKEQYDKENASGNEVERQIAALRRRIISPTSKEVVSLLEFLAAEPKERRRIEAAVKERLRSSPDDAYLAASRTVLENPRVFTLAEAARHARFTESSFRKLIVIPPALSVGPHKLIREDELDNWIRAEAFTVGDAVRQWTKEPVGLEDKVKTLEAMVPTLDQKDQKEVRINHRTLLLGDPSQISQKDIRDYITFMLREAATTHVSDTVRKKLRNKAIKRITNRLDDSAKIRAWERDSLRKGQKTKVKMELDLMSNERRKSAAVLLQSFQDLWEDAVKEELKKQKKKDTSKKKK